MRFLGYIVRLLLQKSILETVEYELYLWFKVAFKGVCFYKIH